MSKLRITEAEFLRNEQERLSEFADVVTTCGLSLYDISRGAGVKLDTLLRVVKKKAINAYNESRIRYYIKRYQDGNEKN